MTKRPHPECTVLRDTAVPMRDGVNLYADIYLPSDGTAGPWPVVLKMTPYDKSGVLQQERGLPEQRNDEITRFFALEGYAAVVTDTRGRYKSEGMPYSIGMGNEGPDGYDTLVWIGKQRWCDGRVGTYGTSYVAYTQFATAVEDPPHLATMVPCQGPTNLHDWHLRVGGAYVLGPLIGRLTWFLRTYREAREDPKVRAALEQFEDRMPQWLGRLPFRRGLSPMRLVPSFEDWFFKTYTEGDFTDFWRSPMLALDEYYERHKDVPVYFISSWYDPFPFSNAREYAALQKLKRGPMKLLLGPWVHGRTSERYSGDVDFGFDAAIDLEREQLRWFDATLKGMDNGVLSEPPVKIFVMGGGTGRRNPSGRLDHGGRWRFEHEWPLDRTVYTPYYLHEGGELTREPPGDELPDTYQYDPRDPVPSIGGANGHIFEPAGGQDQRGRSELWWCKDDLPLSARSDVLVFQTSPLKQPLEVTGAIEVVLYASSDCPDTDFTAKLIDTYPPNDDYPDGYQLNLSDGIIRARYRHSKEKAELMQPGEVYRFQITIPTTSNLFQANHRIRLDISSSSFPNFDPNPNTGEPLGRHRMMRLAANTVYHDGDHPSHVVLPIIPDGDVSEGRVHIERPQPL